MSKKFKFVRISSSVYPYKLGWMSLRPTKSFESQSLFCMVLSIQTSWIILNCICNCMIILLVHQVRRRRNRYPFSFDYIVDPIIWILSYILENNIKEAEHLTCLNHLWFNVDSDTLGLFVILSMRWEQQNCMRINEVT